MMQLKIGKIVGVVHERPHRRYGGSVAHRAQRAILNPVAGFHFDSGTYHAMRPYIVEYAEHADYCRFIWSTLCGILKLYVDAEGRCEEPWLSDDLTPYC